MTDDKVAELKAATREANETLKDLQRERKELTKLAADHREAFMEVLKAEQPGEVIIAHIDTMKKEMNVALERLINKRAKEIMKHFDELANLLLGKVPRSRVPTNIRSKVPGFDVEDAVRAIVAIEELDEG